MSVVVNTPDVGASDSAANPLAARRCSRCLQIRHISKYRWEYKAEGKRHGECTNCEVTRQRELRILRREKAFRDFGYQAKRKRNPHAVAALCEELMRRHGGAENVAKLWHEAFDHAERPGRHATVLRSCHTIFCLMLAAEQLATPVTELSDSELADRKAEAILEFIRYNPAIAVAAGRALGWTVIPPDTRDN